ncbi:MAG: sulfotransferase family protein, partial [Halioglobus sp.]
MAVTTPDLDYDALLAEASARTGLEDFGDDSFRLPLRRLLLGLNEEANLNALGSGLQHDRLLGFLINRLRFEKLWQSHPEIADEEIAPPVVIIGLGRTGTTLLQRLLATDHRFHAPLWWETRFPIPFEGEALHDPRNRIDTALGEVRMMYETVPNLDAIHPLDALQADEDILLLEQSFFSTTPESFAHLPAFGQWLDTQDQSPGYHYLKRLLQCLQWQKRQRGQHAKRWLLKTPHHIHYTDVLLKVFPGAQIIQAHRDPVTVVPSWASLVYALWQQNSDTADPLEAGRYWSDKLATGLNRCMQVRDASGERTWLDVH